MPELPEVEVSRLGIAPYLEGRTISAIIARAPKLRWPVPRDELARLADEPVVAVTRRAKYLIIETAKGSILLHLGMSGSLRIIDADTPAGKHDHFDLQLDSGKALRLNDPRRFGAVLFIGPGESHEALAKLGPEPLSDDFDAERLIKACEGRSKAIKLVIMDNAVVVGVGNIYANEALFAAGIQPQRQAGKISKARLTILVECIKEVLARAITQGGTTLKDFTQSDGKPGYFAQELQVYGRSGEACNHCETELKELKIGQRATVYCPRCQR